MIPRALKLVVLAALSTSCGLVAGLGDPPTYVGPGDASSGTNSAGVGGASGSTNPAGGTGGNIVGAAGNSAGNSASGAGPAGNMAVATCIGDCPDAFAVAQEASAISFCRGQVCPADSGVIAYAEAGGTCIPGTTAPCGSDATCNAGAVATCDKNGTYGTCPASGFTCNAVPDTWQPVALSDMTGNCPPGFALGKQFYTSASGDPLGCGCQCGGAQTCSGSFTLNEYSSDGGPSCTGAPSTRTMAVSSGCGAGAGNVLFGNAYSISDVTYAPGPACSASPTVIRTPQVVTTSVTICSATSTCPSGACVDPANAINLCVEKSGTNACPMGYSKQTIMSPAVDDNRMCGACTCGSTLTCSLTGVLLDNAANCVLGHPYLMTATDTCSDSSLAPASFPLNTVMGQGTITGTGACATTAPSMPTGKAILQDATTVTVCCR